MNSADYLSVVESRHWAVGRRCVAVVVSPRPGLFVAFVREAFAPQPGERILTGPECDSALDAALGLAMAPTRKHGTEGRR